MGERWISFKRSSLQEFEVTQYLGEDLRVLSVLMDGYPNTVPNSLNYMYFGSLVPDLDPFVRRVRTTMIRPSPVTPISRLVHLLTSFSTSTWSFDPSLPPHELIRPDFSDPNVDVYVPVVVGKDFSLGSV